MLLRWLFHDMATGAGLDRLLKKVPSAVFEASLPGVREYGLLSRAACLGVKFLEYSLAGMFCGFLGQGVANGMMLAKYVTSVLSMVQVSRPTAHLA